MLNIKVRYLHHSGFSVETKNHFFVFDYYPGNKSFYAPFNEGGIEIEKFPQKAITIFSSHIHGDHYDPRILELSDKFQDISFVLSYDIGINSDFPNIFRPGPDEKFNIGDVSIHTLKSTDEGVAFLIKADGYTIYHAGDLNWWHWEGEPDEDNIAMGNAYCAEIDKLKSEKIDIAFLTLDPRQESDYLRGLSYFMDTVDAKHVFPMHFDTDFSVFDWFEKDKSTNNYRNAVHRIHHRGELFIL